MKFIYTFRKTFLYFEICTSPCETPHIGMCYICSSKLLCTTSLCQGTFVFVAGGKGGGGGGKERGSRGASGTLSNYNVLI